MVKYLIKEAKVKSNKANNKGFTPLIGSACNGFLNVVKYFIEDIGEDPN